MGDYIPSVLFLIILLCLSALFSASETALTAANRIRLKTRAEDGDKKAKTAMGLIAKYDDTLSALLIANNVVNLLSASYTTVFFTKLFNSNAVGMATGVITVLVIIFGEVIPKSYANANADSLIKAVAKPLQILSVVLFPAIKILEIIKKPIKKRTAGEETPSVTEEELISIIDEIEDEGVLEEDQADLVQSAIEFADITADEILTPRVDICAVDEKRTNREILNKFTENNFSRMPVYSENIDNIIGFITQKDFFAMVINGEKNNIKSMLKPCLYVPPKKKIIDIMHIFQNDKVQMAVVTDEYGGTHGILTLEDILEELVGEIWDEYDEEKKMINQLDENTWDVLGDMPVDDLWQEILGKDNEETDEYVTISGYLMAKMNKIPALNESYTDDCFKYTVKSVKGNRINKVRVKKLPNPREET